MFLDRSRIREALFELVGFQQTVNSTYPQLAPSLTRSSLGLYIDDVHSLIAIENIDQSKKNFSQYPYPVYSITTKDNGGYTLGNKVISGSEAWEWINPNPSTPSSDNPSEGSDWTAINELSDYLIGAVYNGIDRLLDTYMNGKKARGVTKTLMDSVLLYNGQGNLDDLEANQDRFVGLRIRFKKRERHLLTILNRIGHQFSGSFAGLEIKLYNISQKHAVATYTISQASTSFEWTALSTGNNLQYADLYDAGSDWFIGYKQSDLQAFGANAVNRDLIWMDVRALDNDVWRSYYQQYSRFIDVQGFKVLESDMPNDEIFPVDKYSIQPYRSYGLNLDLTIKNDLSQFFIDQKDALGQAVKFNTGMVLLEQMAANTRGSNQIANQVRALAEKQLYHHDGAYGTVYDQCKEANENVRIDFSGMGNSGMPTDNNRSFKVRRGAI